MAKKNEPNDTRIEITMTRLAAWKRLSEAGPVKICVNEQTGSVLAICHNGKETMMIGRVKKP